MTEFFLDAHRWWQYAVLLAIVVSLVFAFRSSMMDSTAETVYRVTTVTVDIQVALGIVVWLANSGWSLGFMQAWVHPSSVSLHSVSCMPSSGGPARVTLRWPIAPCVPGS